MSYRISYLMPKKESACLIGKKQSRAVQQAPAKKSSTPRRKAKPKKASSAPRRHAKSEAVTSKKRERTRKAKSPDREKTRGKRVKQSGVRKKTLSARRGTRSLGTGEKSDDHH